MTQLDTLYSQLEKLQMTECSVSSRIAKMEGKQVDNEALLDDTTFQNKLAILDEKLVQVTEAIEAIEAEINQIEVE